MILGVGIHPLDSAHGLAVQLCEQLLRRLGVVHVGGRHQHGQQQPHAVHDDVAFAAVHVLGVVPAALLSARGRIDRLAVHARRGAGRLRFLRRADFATEKVVDRIERAVASPLVEVTPDGAFGREVLGQVTPLTAGAEKVENGVDDLSQVGLAGPSAGMDGEMGFDQNPLCIADVAGIGLCSHVALYAFPPPYGTGSKTYDAILKHLVEAYPKACLKSLGFPTTAPGARN